MRTACQVFCLVAILLGSLFLIICLGAPGGHGARELITGLPVIIAGGLVGLAILTKDDRDASRRD